MFKVIKDNHTEIFLDSIPRWITHFGFGLSVLIFIGLVTTTSMISYPRVVAIKVNIGQQQNIAKTDFSTFNQLGDNQKLTIDSPFGSITGTLNKAEAWAEQSSMYIPVEIDEAQKQKLVFKNEMNCNAEIMLDNLTLLQKLMD